MSSLEGYFFCLVKLDLPEKDLVSGRLPLTCLLKLAPVDVAAGLLCAFGAVVILPQQS